MAARAAAEVAVVAAEGAATEAPPERLERGVTHERGRKPAASRATPRRTTYRRMAFTSAGMTLAGWPPHVARR